MMNHWVSLKTLLNPGKEYSYLFGRMEAEGFAPARVVKLRAPADKVVLCKNFLRFIMFLL